MKNHGRVYLIVGAVIAAMLFVSNFSFAESSKSRLIYSIDKQQKQYEKQIVDLWMKGERGKPLELALSEYVTLEIRKGALLEGDNKNPTLLSIVADNGNYKPDNTLDVAREIVLEYYKKKGIDLKTHNFIKGEYYLQTDK